MPAMQSIILSKPDETKKEISIHLGCGQKYLDGWVNVDKLTTVKTDKIVDLTVFPWPFEDNSADRLYSDNVFEHLPDQIKTMEECYRILRPGGVLECKVPFAMSSGALQDPTHKAFWTDYTINYFIRGHQANFYTPCGFDLVFCRLVSNSDTMRCRLRNLIPFRGVLKLMLFGMYDLVHFQVTKPKK
jgi:SAM-dependent methyltransferase